MLTPLLFSDNFVPHQLGQAASPLKATLPTTNRKRCAAKIARQSGKAYTTTKGKYVGSKEFVFARCSCRYQCKEMTFVKRLGIFKDFWNLSSWQSQSNYSLSCISVSAVKRTTVSSESRRVNSRTFHFNDTRVCKFVFIKTLGIASNRVQYCLEKSANGMCSPDKRGKKGVKVDPVKINGVNDFLNSIPKYESHYTLSQKKYFSPDLNKEKLYRMYCKKSDRPVSKTVFTRVFKQYNIGFYVPKQDTCRFCDEFKIKEMSNKDQVTLQSIKEEKKLHLERALAARSKMTQVTSLAQKNSKMLSFTFDMQQTSPLPKIETSVVFYKRQLWVYNLGIHNLKNHDAYMMVWLEGEAKRGSSEICSSILEFFNVVNLEKFNCISSFSDSCAGQNRNKNIICFSMYICNVYDIDFWEHQYLESGHTYLPNDRDFGLIAKRGKHANVYDLDQWTAIIEEARVKNPFNVIKMKNKFKKIESLSASRKFNNNKTNAPQKFNFNKLRYFKVKKGSDIVMYKEAGSDVLHELQYPRLSGMDINNLKEKLDCEKISDEKYKDVLSLMDFIPPPFREFYINCNH